jgi:hypothetical protein
MVGERVGRRPPSARKPRPCRGDLRPDRPAAADGPSRGWGRPWSIGTSRIGTLPGLPGRRPGPRSSDPRDAGPPKAIDEHNGDLAAIVRPAHHEPTQPLPWARNARWIGRGSIGVRGDSGRLTGHAECGQDRRHDGRPEATGSGIQHKFLPEVVARPRRSAAYLPSLSVPMGHRALYRCGTEEIPVLAWRRVRRAWDDQGPVVSDRSKFDDGLRTDAAVFGRAPGSRRRLASFGSFQEAVGRSIIASIACLRTGSTSGTQANLVGLHAGDGGLQHGFESRPEGGRGVVDRGGRTPPGPVGPRPEPGESPPPTGPWEPSRSSPDALEEYPRRSGRPPLVSSCLLR